MPHRLFALALAFIVSVGFAAESERKAEPPTAQQGLGRGEFTRPGLILAAKVKGGVTMTTVDGPAIPLLVDASLPKGVILRSAADSSAVLSFSNATSLTLGANSELSIEEFLQDPFAHTIKVSEVTIEPSPSRTKLKFVRGEVVVGVPKLRFPQGSSFEVETPAGVVSVRGTVFRLKSVPAAGGTQTGQVRVDVAEGSVIVWSPGGTSQTVTTGNPLVLPVVKASSTEKP